MTLLFDLEIGETLEPIVLRPVSRLDLIKYAGASGDFNPIHTIDEEAKKAGLPGIIAHGMWTMGNLSKLFSNYLEEGFVKDYKIRFKNMVFLNDVLTLRAFLQKVEENSYHFNVFVTNQKDEKVIDGGVVFQTY